VDKPTLIYFPVRGRAELIRLVLVEAGVDFQEHSVVANGPTHQGRPTDFAQLKQSGLLPFQAVPVWEEPDGFRLAQSLAIVRYLSRKHGLLGGTPREEALVDQVLGLFDDVRPELRKLVTVAPADRAATRTELNEVVLPRWLGNMDRLLASNRDGVGFIVGESFTVADLAFWYLLELIRDNGFGARIDRYPRLVRYEKRIEERPQLKSYRASERRPKFVPPPA
jgi:glutathione S-transferase